MTRPALSALRAIEIIDFLSQAPSQPYTLSELVRHTGTNVASLHAILNVLLARGYLIRHPQHKTYRLSPALAAIGKAVAASEPMIGHARAAAEDLARRIGLEVTVTARVGEDVICLARAAGDPRARASMRIGQRLTLRPPLGAIYYAWAEAEDVDAWIQRGGGSDLTRARVAMDLLRERGFLVTVRSSEQAAFSRAMAEGHDPEIRRMLKALEQALYQPEVIEPEAQYDVDLISAPIFDHMHQATYALNLTGFAGHLSGAEVEGFGARLREAARDVMRDSGVHIPR